VNTVSFKKDVMKSAIIKRVFFLIILSVLFAGCNTGPRPATIRVPMLVNVRADNSVNFTNLNIDQYRLKVMDFLDDFREVDLDFVEGDENASIVLDLTVESFNVWPAEERRSRRTFRRNIQVGTSNGKPVYQTAVATVDFLQRQIRSSARLSSRFTFKDAAYKVSPQSYFATYTWSDVSVDNVQGDPRAVDPAVYSHRSTASFEPFDEEILFALSRRDMLGRISYDLRKYYQKLRS
jgi:hypothetical protein